MTAGSLQQILLLLLPFFSRSFCTAVNAHPSDVGSKSVIVDAQGAVSEDSQNKQVDAQRFPLMRKEVQADIKEDQPSGGIDDHLSYLVERGVKVYLYELPAELNLKLVDCYKEHEGRDILDDFREEKGQNTADIWIHRILEKHPLRTSNPNEASMFFIPFYGFLSSYFSGITKPSTAGPSASATCGCAGRGHYDRLSELAEILQRSEHFRERPEAHIMPVSFWAVARESVEPRLAPPSVITGPLFKLLQKSILLVYEPKFGSMESLDDHKKWPGKLVTIPYVAKSSLTAPPLTSLGPLGAREISFFFQGTIHSAYSPNLKTRQRLAEAFHKVPGARIIDTNKHYEGNSYEAGMSRSSFCPVLQGDTPTSSRLFDAIAAGCLPLVISDGVSLPFSDFLDWPSFSVQLPSSSLLVASASSLQVEAPQSKEGSSQQSDALTQVMSMSTSHLKEMQRRLHLVRESFIYGRGSFKDFTPGLAVDNILIAVARTMGLG
eukprot:TRINITY_DN48164_c0_g1_i1.p1 TRINITY_DN48164_c0_g1~~TRINITY_DN48164_c0_g1_i1.p1  ORF type:complete len:492 (+),score=53.78 TRINITY_DN48164_c0_g1_i1:94-1569(+)